MNREKDKQKLLDLQDGASCTVFWCDEGGGWVTRLGNTLQLLEIPMFGGEGAFMGNYALHEIDKLLDEVYSWT